LFSFVGLVGKFLDRAIPEEHHPQVSLGIMISLILGLMPACKYGKASYLMGVFIAGLSFCRDNEVHHLFVSQFKRLLQVSELIFSNNQSYRRSHIPLIPFLIVPLSLL